MKKCIYVVEDNRNLREVIEFLLVEEEYDVKSCSSLREFWRQMKNQLPDMVVLDVLLPDGNGMDICAKLKESVKTHLIPVMMMSANNFLNKVKSKCAAEAFINKPFDINDFINRIEKFAPN